jgi:hypothetical protein
VVLWEQGAFRAGLSQLSAYCDAQTGAGLTALPQSNIARLHALARQRTIATGKNSPGESSIEGPWILPQPACKK